MASKATITGEEASQDVWHYPIKRVHIASVEWERSHPESLSYSIAYLKKIDLET